MSNPHSHSRALARTAVMGALCAVLTLVSVRAGNLRITFAFLPALITSVLFGPLQGAAVALIGEFLNQLLSYGLTATTLLWLLPPAVRAVCVGVAARRLRAKGHMLEAKPVLWYTVVIASTLLTTLCNTAVIWLDSVLYGYYSFAYVFGDTALRLFTGVITAAVVGTLALPLLRFLRKQPFLQREL
ncbi:MAG: folate family ECF transporter S component [Faecalibacterium sp.]|jgi:ECF transporter S component (folate family)|nr:folate family ECF transporter S component [Faecalibacterium sp.]